MMLIDLRVYRYSTDSRIISLACLRSGSQKLGVDKLMGVELWVELLNLISKCILLYFSRLCMIAPFMDDAN